MASSSSTKAIIDADTGRLSIRPAPNGRRTRRSVRSPRSARSGRQRAEHQREDLAVPQPGVAAEHEHAGQGERRIGNGQSGDVCRRGGIRIDELGPGKGQQEQARRPRAQRFGIGQPQAQRTPSAEPPVEPLRSVEDGPPRVDEGPDVAGEGRDQGKPHPPDDPHQGRGDIAVGVLVADQAGHNRDDEQRERGEPKRQDDVGMRDDRAERTGEQVQLRRRCAARRRAARTGRRRRTTAQPPPRRRRGRARAAAAARSVGRSHGRAADVLAPAAAANASNGASHADTPSAGGLRCGQAGPRHGSDRAQRACALRPGTAPSRAP